MSKIGKVTQVTSNSHLNFYEVEAVTRSGDTFPYFVASRAKDVAHLKMTSGAQRPDGVMIFALYGEEKRVVLVRQFRYPVGDYVYEFPAGLVEEGEDMHLAAVRECREETGLNLTPIQVDPLFERAYFSTDGMTDESCGIVYGYVAGTVSTKGQEETEDIEVILADREEVLRILREEKVALPTAYQLMHYISADDPFAFMQGVVKNR